eukprot:2600189-Amphidinium_carterae.1
MPKACNEKFYERLTGTTSELPRLESQTEQDRAREQRDIHHDEVYEQFIVVKETTLDDWINKGMIPRHNIQIHTRIDSTGLRQQAKQFDERYYYHHSESTSTNFFPDHSREHSAVVFRNVQKRTERRCKQPVIQTAHLPRVGTA